MPLGVPAHTAAAAAVSLLVLAGSLAGVRLTTSSESPKPATSDQVMSAPSERNSEPPGAPAEASTTFVADGLTALYARNGLDVPTALVPRADRPGCQPTTSGDPAGPEPGVNPEAPPITLVPEDALPAPAPLIEFTTDASVVEGHGMWLWQYTKTEGGDYRQMVERAVGAGLDHVWVRAGDSRDGFYAKEYLDEFVPLAHAAGLRVIGWGFPYLLDPELDSAWTNEALDWVGPHGRGLDAWSPDIERESEGVVLTARRAVLHLAAIRAAHPELPLIATVYPATDWIMASSYPYEAMAPYVDAYATMDYWSCGDSGIRAAHSIRRLQALRPVHVIGQAFAGGRRAAPSNAETWRFLDTAVKEGAIGASWWVWQLIGDEQWDAVSRYPWHDAVRSNARSPEAAVIPES
ncbi:MAG: hypothetical protein ACI867_001955 [Glaciecola sp.]|jgi:hypothetical protein